VKLLAIAFPFVLFAASALLAQDPRVPGVRQGEQAQAQVEKDIPPAMQPHAQLDMARLRQDADQLAKLAQTIPSDVLRIQSGMLPKDMSDKLKQIEKLSKHLRSQIMP
jgi:hypothetical protein